MAGNPACQSNAVSPVPSVGPRIPNAIGTKWHYVVEYVEDLDTMGIQPQVDPSLIVLHKEGVDTVSLEIKDTTTLSAAGLPALVWELSDHLDTLGFLPFQQLWWTGLSNSLSDGDTVAFYALPYATHPAFYYVVPLSEGQEWLCTECELWTFSGQDYQRYTVEYVPFLETPAGRFSSLFKITHSYQCSDECGGRYSYWLKDRIGIVKIEQTAAWWGVVGSSRSRMTWELLDFDLLGRHGRQSPSAGPLRIIL